MVGGNMAYVDGHVKWQNSNYLRACRTSNTGAAWDGMCCRGGRLRSSAHRRIIIPLAPRANRSAPPSGRTNLLLWPCPAASTPHPSFAPEGSVLEIRLGAWHAVSP